MSREGKHMRIFSVLVLCGAVGCAQHHAITGAVIDRNGEPLDRVIVSVAPGNVEILSDEHGSFVVDYLRVDSGDDNIDPALYPDRAQNNGAAYEGE
jgi:hypothetical protein